MNIIVLIATLNLILQLVILSVVISGYILKRKMRLIEHGTFMLVAVVMQSFSFALVMGPALVIIIELGFFQKPILLYTVTLFHAILGGTSLATGIWITASWHLQTSIKDCIRKRPVMRYLIITWILALIFGISLYLLTYVIT
jgi:hypothetical protein